MIDQLYVSMYAWWSSVKFWIIQQIQTEAV